MFWLGLLLFFCFTGGSASEESTCNAEDAKDAGTIPGLGRSPGEGNGVLETHSSIFAWEIPWTEKPRGPQSMGSQQSQTQPRVHAHGCMHTDTHTDLFSGYCDFWFGSSNGLLSLPFLLLS